MSRIFACRAQYDWDQGLRAGNWYTAAYTFSQSLARRIITNHHFIKKHGRGKVETIRVVSSLEEFVRPFLKEAAEAKKAEKSFHTKLAKILAKPDVIGRRKKKRKP